MFSDRNSTETSSSTEDLKVNKNTTRALERSTGTTNNYLITLRDRLTTRLWEVVFSQGNVMFFLAFSWCPVAEALSYRAEALGWKESVMAAH